MSLQWLSAAAFLYAEIALGVLLSIEFISNARWQSIFSSRLLALVKQYGHFLFNAFVLLMLVLFAESIHSTYKFSNVKFDMSLRNNPQAEIQAHMKLFRAQRNLYITGFSLFMLILLKRLVTLISRQATLEASHEAVMKQAKGASEQAKKLLDENEKLIKGKRKESSEDEDEKEKLKSQVNELKSQLRDKEEKLASAGKNLDAMKKQSDGLSNEYNRLAEEHNKIEKKLNILGYPADNQPAESVNSKKDD